VLSYILADIVIAVPDLQTCRLRRLLGSIRIAARRLDNGD
jgi:hypothetical protein